MPDQKDLQLRHESDRPGLIKLGIEGRDLLWRSSSFVKLWTKLKGCYDVQIGIQGSLIRNPRRVPQGPFGFQKLDAR